MYLLDQVENSFYIFTTNSIQKYSFPQLFLIKEKQFQRKELLASCGIFREIRQYLFCAINQSSIILIDRDTLSINLVYKVKQINFYFYTIKMNQQFQVSKKNIQFYQLQ
ncbi:hypothetical protein ABPG72_021723 [Tetrahymena utriculariae]